jgi:hypothetical protein
MQCYSDAILIIRKPEPGDTETFAASAAKKLVSYLEICRSRE